MTGISVIILAAGTSSRMGKANKLFLDFNGKAIIDWVIENLSDSQVDEIILVSSEVSRDKLSQFENARVLLVDNPNYKSGMTSSIQRGVQAAKEGNAVMICLGDLPLIKSQTYDQLIEFSESNRDSIIVPAHNGKKGNPVIFPSSLRQAILTHTEPEGCKGVVEAHSDLVKLLEVNDSGILKDVDTHEDYMRLKE